MSLSQHCTQTWSAAYCNSSIYLGATSGCLREACFLPPVPSHNAATHPSTIHPSPKSTHHSNLYSYIFRLEPAVCHALSRHQQSMHLLLQSQTSSSSSSVGRSSSSSSIQTSTKVTATNFGRFDDERRHVTTSSSLNLFNYFQY